MTCSKIFLQLYYTVANFWPYPIRCHATKTSALQNKYFKLNITKHMLYRAYLKGCKIMFCCFNHSVRCMSYREGMVPVVIGYIAVVLPDSQCETD